MIVTSWLCSIHSDCVSYEVIAILWAVSFYPMNDNYVIFRFVMLKVHEDFILNTLIMFFTQQLLAAQWLFVTQWLSLWRSDCLLHSDYFLSHSDCLLCNDCLLHSDSVAQWLSLWCSDCLLHRVSLLHSDCLSDAAIVCYTVTVSVTQRLPAAQWLFVTQWLSSWCSDYLLCSVCGCYNMATTNTNKCNHYIIVVALIREQLCVTHCLFLLC